ncbi:MAG: hypothetical protein IJK04_00890 [Kiritimatiellae bacterium]|nr:hypothetical protein [Kiritimatiellia bacterium]
MTPIQGTTPNAISWQGLLDKLAETSGAAKISADNRSLVFTATVNGVESQVTVRIPDDLELPGEVDEAAITSLVGKLSDPAFNLTEGEIAAFKEQITKIYNDASAAVAETKSRSTGSVMFDLYKLMALLVEVAQSQRDAARDLRSAQSAQIQNSIQSQADTQRSAAMVGLIVGVVCGAVSAIVSGVMLGMQGNSYKNQLSAARSSGADAAQTNANMVKGADTAAHANAQLQKVEGQVGEPIATDVRNAMDAKLAAPKARVERAEAALTPEKQAQLQTAQFELNELRAGGVKDPQAIQQAQSEVTQTRAAAGIPEGKTAAKAKFDYVRECAKSGNAADEAKMLNYDKAIQAENKLAAANKAPTAEQLTAKETAVTNLRAEINDAKTELSAAKSEYRASIKNAADAYADKYESAVAADGPNSKAAQTARNEMRMARAYAGSKLQEQGVSTAAEHRLDVAEATDAVDRATQRLNASADYRDALHNIEVFSGINAINTAIGNMLQGMTQNITGMINAEATKKGAEQEQQKDQLDQVKDLFQQAQSLIDSVVQLMQAVAAAESQSMRDAIQA